MSCNYSTISNFGPRETSAQNDPLTYCLVSGLESGFHHTLGSGASLIGPDSGQCQLYMAGYCANNWDGACEYIYNDKSTALPNMVSACGGPYGSCSGPGIGNSQTKGDILLYNTAAEKYLVQMSGNCVRVYQPFDPTVASSPLVGTWKPTGNSCGPSGSCSTSGTSCIPIYDVDAKQIDTDIVMNKILNRPWVAIPILLNIYQNRFRTNRLGELKNTKLGRFFVSEQFQKLLR